MVSFVHLDCNEKCVEIFPLTSRLAKTPAQAK